MHELAVMQAVVDQVSERLGDQRVATIRLSVGRLSGVVPDALRFCFELSTSGTCLDGAELTIEEPSGARIEKYFVLIAWAVVAVAVGINSREDVGRYLKIRSM